MASKQPEYLPSIGRLLGFASAACNTISDRRLARYDLTIRQWVLLTAIWRASPMTESELAGYARMSLSALHKLLDRMEAKQLVAREADEQDARRVIVRAGPRAKKLSHLINFYQEINEVALHGLNRKERENLVQLLEKVVDNLEKETRSPGSGR